VPDEAFIVYVTTPPNQRIVSFIISLFEVEAVADVGAARGVVGVLKSRCRSRSLCSWRKLSER
jgi:hypothetical protein